MKKLRQNFSRNSQNLEPRYNEKLLLRDLNTEWLYKGEKSWIALSIFSVMWNISNSIWSLIIKMAFPISFRGIVEPILAGKLDNRVPNGLIRFPKEGSNTSMPEFRRSRSSPRGKFLILPWGFHNIQYWILLPLISFPSKFCTVTTISVQVPNCLLLLWGFWWCFGGDYGGASFSFADKYSGNIFM